MRDEIIRNNPTDGVMKEISREIRKEQRNQTCIDRRAAKSIHGIHCEPSDILSLVAYVYGVAWNRVQNWRSIRARWQDLDYDRRTISINHSLSYYQKPESNKSVLRISTPKTEAGIRTIPMLDVVKDSFEMLL